MKFKIAIHISVFIFTGFLTFFFLSKAYAHNFEGSFYSTNRPNIIWQVGYRVLDGWVDRSPYREGFTWKTLVNGDNCFGIPGCTKFVYWSQFYVYSSWDPPFHLQWGTACIDPRPALTAGVNYEGVPLYRPEGSPIDISFSSAGVTDFANDGGGTLYFSSFYNTINCPQPCPVPSCSGRCGTITNSCGKSANCGGCRANYCGTGTNRCDRMGEYCDSGGFCRTQTVTRNASVCEGTDGACFSDAFCGAGSYCSGLSSSPCGVCKSTAQIAGRVYIDVKDNGTYDSAVDDPLPNVTVSANGGYSAVTGGAGRYLISGIRPNPSSRDVSISVGDTCDQIIAGANVKSVTATETLNNVDFRFITRRYNINGRVFRDDNRNGVYDAGIDTPLNETGMNPAAMQSIKVRTLKANGDPTGNSALLDANARYSIPGHRHGRTYSVQLLRSTLPGEWDTSGGNRIDGVTINCADSGGHRFLVARCPGGVCPLVNQRPDLEVEFFSFPSACAGDPAAWWALVTNSGNAGTGSGFNLTVGNGAGQFDTIGVGALPAGGSQWISWTNNIPPTPGSYLATATADSFGGITESDETNNSSTSDFTSIDCTPLPTPTPTPTPPPTYNIQGGVFYDTNENEIKDGAEAYAPGILNIAGSDYNSGPITSIQLPPGIYNVSFPVSSLLPGYESTYPKSLAPLIPPQVDVLIGPNANGGTHAYAIPDPIGSGNVINVNFGIRKIPATKWFHGIGGDVRSDYALTNIIPESANAYFSDILTERNLASGIAFGNSLTLNLPSVSPRITNPSNWNVPDKFAGNTIKTSYEFVSANLKKGGYLNDARPLFADPRGACGGLATSTCDLSDPLTTFTNGVYVAEKDVTFTGGVLEAVDGNYIFLINGDLTIDTNTIVTPGSTAFFIVSGDIKISKDVLYIEGVFSANGTFTVEGVGDGSGDNQLIIAGSVIANAGRTLRVPGFINQRDLLRNNDTTPAVQIIYRPDFVLNAPELIRTANYIIKEVAPGDLTTFYEDTDEGPGGSFSPPPAPAENYFTGKYYDYFFESDGSPNNRYLDLKLTRTESGGANGINFDWGTGSPDPAVRADQFAARWEGTFDFSTTGTYRFTIRTDDGFRLYIDDVLKYDTWVLQSATQIDHSKVDIPITAGTHKVRAEYFENGGYAVAQLSWNLISTPDDVPPAP